MTVLDNLGRIRTMTLRHALLNVARNQSATVQIKRDGVGFFACKKDEKKDDGDRQEFCGEQYCDLDFFFHSRDSFLVKIKR